MFLLRPLYKGLDFTIWCYLMKTESIFFPSFLHSFDCSRKFGSLVPFLGSSFLLKLSHRGNAIVFKFGHGMCYRAPLGEWVSVWAWLVTFIFFGREADCPGASNQSGRRIKAFKRFVSCFSIIWQLLWIMKVSLNCQGCCILAMSLFLIVLEMSI